MTNRTYIPEEIQDLTDRVFLLKDMLDQGKVHIAEHLAHDFEKSLRAIRIGHDGLVDPESVDGRIRAMTLAMVAFRQRTRLKEQYSIQEIQEIYFQILEHQFGQFFKSMIKTGAPPHAVADVLSRDEKLVRNALEVLPEIVAEVRTFWQDAAEVCEIHLQDGEQLKTSFAGDIFPGHWENPVSTAGLYVDTIVLPCPILKMATILEVEPSPKTVAMLFKHVLTAMTYRSLATAAVDPPVVLVLPGERDIRPDNSIIEIAKPYSLKHADYLFGRQFDGYDDLADFLSALPEIDDVMRELKGGDRLLFDSEFPRNPRAQLEGALARGDLVLPGLERAHAGNQVLNVCLGRMPQAIDAQMKASRFGGTPFMSAPTSWDYYTWMLDYESRARGKSSADAHIVHALTSDHAGLQWLGNVPPEVVLKIREAGQANEVRDILSRGIDSLVKINPDNYRRTADIVANNLDAAFRRHQQTIREANAKKLRFYGIDVASCATVGAIAVAAAVTASPVLGAASGLLGIAGAPNLRDIKSRYASLKAEEARWRKTPTALLFQAYKDHAD